jgi:hypothetical protein
MLAPMKKQILFVALLSLIGAALLTGCEKKESAPAPEMPSTNAPAQQ